MRRHVWIGIVVGSFIAVSALLRAESPSCEPLEDCFLKRLAPVGGWHAYGGGLLRWWPPHCFPCSGAPDDYCRKPLPRVCWPPYPGYYIWGPAENCCSEGACRPAGREPR